MNHLTLIEMVDGVWPEIDHEFNWREMDEDEGRALVLACARVLATPYAISQATAVMAAAFAVLTQGYQEAAL